MSKHHAPAEHVMFDAKTTKDLVALLNQFLADLYTAVGGAMDKALWMLKSCQEV